MKLRIDHETRYEYSAPPDYTLQQLRLTPQPNEHQTVLAWSLEVPGKLFAQRDGYGNASHTWTLGKRLRQGAIRAGGLVQTHASARLDDPTELPSPLVYLRATELTPMHPSLHALGERVLAGGVDATRLLALAALVRERVTYRAGSTTVATDAVQALAQGSGVCQDQAHVFVACCRAAAVPARYVSGYLYTGATGEVASHAWAEAWLGDEGWFSVDVTHEAVAGPTHCRLAVGRDYLDAAPVRGVRRGGGREQLTVAVNLAPVATSVTSQPGGHPQQ